MDGGSQDGTVEILRKYSPKIAYWESKPDKGQSHALNKGFARTTGDILAWICADDLYLPGAFRKTLKFFESNPEAEFLYGDGISINVKGEEISPIISGPVLDRNNFHNYNYVFSTTAFWKRSLWEKSGSYIDESNNWTMDWELFIRMNKHAELHYLPGKVACLRKHEDAKTSQGTSKFAAKRNQEIVKVSRMHGGIFCYNSIVHPLLRLTYLAKFSKNWPRPMRSITHRLLFLPLLLTNPNKHSIFFNGKRNSTKK